jgi:hypothetical protein
MKQILVIYLIGVLIGWGLGWGHIRNINKKYKLKTTYGDIAFCSTMSLLSWFNVVPLIFIRVGESEFWSTPINN